METLLERIFEYYGHRLERAEKVEKGFLSENHILSGGVTRYFLKKYRFDASEKIEEIHRAKKYFSESGIRVILPLSTKSGQTFFRFGGGYYALFPFIDRKQPDRSDLTEGMIRSLGETLAHMHWVGERSPFSVAEKLKPWDAAASLKKIERIEERLREKDSLDDFDELAKESIALKKRLISGNALAYEDLCLPSDHLIHGDYLDHNVFFGADGAVSHVFDFEKVEHSPRVYELLRSILYIFGDTNFPHGLARAKGYMEAYSEIYPISKGEILRGLKLFYLKSVHGAWVESEHYLKGSTRVDCFLAPDLMRIKFLSEHADVLEDFFAWR